MGFAVEASSRLESGPLGLPVINNSGLDTEEVLQSSDMREIARKVSGWIDNARKSGQRGSMFERETYSPPDNPYDEMRAARDAMSNDDIVSGVAELTEAFAFQGVKWEGPNADDADVFNQISRDVDLDSMIRKVWHDLYGYSQTVVGMIWGWKEYTVRGKTDKGNNRKKKYRVWCPVDMRTLDVTNIVPVGGSGPFGGDHLAWCSTFDELETYGRASRGEIIDPLMAMFFEGPYKPVTKKEEVELAQLGVDVHNLLLMNPDMTWRHTLTRPDYERFPKIRLKSVFPLLDIKRQQMRADRAALIGQANYILLIRKGSKEQPAQQPELDNLRENYNFIAKLPVVISDHRLEMEIIAPKTDFTLQRDRYDLLDTRILVRLLGTLTLGTQGQRNETNITLSHTVARSMDNRRRMTARAFERNLARKIVNHPRNHDDRGNPLFTSEPSLVYVPRTVALEINEHVIQSLMNLRTMHEISRDTILEHFGLDQQTEAQRIEYEREFYDDVFQTVIPFDSPEHDVDGGEEAPAESGPRGGRPKGGGSSSKNATKSRGKTDGGNTPKGES